MFGTPLFWRETHRQPRFLFMDGRLVVLLLMAVMHIRIWTVALAVVTIFIFWLFERRGISADNIIRYLRASLVGRKRSARGLSEERVPRDFGFEDALIVQKYQKSFAKRETATKKSDTQKPAKKKKKLVGAS